MASPPEYGPTASLDASWLNADQTTKRYPSYSRIQRDSPKDLATSETESISRLYSQVSPAVLLEDDSKYMKDIARLWSDLNDDTLACLIVDEQLASYFIELAEQFILLRNFHSATALDSALGKWGFQPRKSLPVWTITDPKDNFAACRAPMLEKPCLPFIAPYIMDLRKSRNAPDQLIKAFQFVGYFGKSPEGEIGQNARVGEK